MATKRYIVNFRASTNGVVLITGKSKRDALKNLREGPQHVWDQIEDQLHNMKAGEFDIHFYDSRITEDEDQGTDPFTDFGQDDEEEQ